jgi:hypothetical protein
MALDGPTSSAVGQSFTVRVTLRDQYGNLATEYTGAVHFSTSDPLATLVLPADYTFSAADAGSRTFSVRLLTLGGQTLTASDNVRPALNDTHSVAVRLL